MKPPFRFRPLFGLLLFPTIVVLLTILIAQSLESPAETSLKGRVIPPDAEARIDGLDAVFEAAWAEQEIVPTPEADPLTVIRRLSLALTGAPPSLEGLRLLERIDEDADPVQTWLDHLFEDSRYHHYFAERLARAFVGVEPGPFLVYRRRRLVNWLADELASNRPYDAMVRDLVASKGVWTTNPEVNFITATVIQNSENNGPDEVKLAARTSRAFLGISLDCMECHDDKFGNYWKQKHFHELAAFYAQTEMSLTGVREKRSQDYEVRFLGKSETEIVEASVPFQKDLLPDQGNRRTRLATWIAHHENEAFARAAVNRVWALLAGRPLLSPVDEIPLEGPYPAGLEELANFFVEENHNLQALIRLIAASEPFRRESQSHDPTNPVTQAQEEAWAAFPITPLRSEQIAGSIIQSSSLRALDEDISFFSKLQRFGDTSEFVKRFGDQGENEFAEEAGTIPQRLLLMNGKLVAERTKPNPLMNSSTRLANYSPSDTIAIESAFLATLTRQPNENELAHFLPLLNGANRKAKARAMHDLYWALINSTEFSWNR